MPEPASPPVGALELEVAALWEELLGRGPLDRDADFFALGGDSLLALRMTEAVRARLGVELPLAALLDGATVASVAEGLARRRAAAPHVLLRLRAGRGGPPLLLVHPAGGSALCYLDLARALPAARPVLGLQEPPGVASAEPSIEERAALYRPLVEAAVPAGPLTLAGHSFGGLVAFELARRLGTARVRAVVLVDTAPPGGDAPPADLVRELAELLDRAPLDGGGAGERELFEGLAGLAGRHLTGPREAGPARLGEIERFCRRHRFLPDGAFGYAELLAFFGSMRAAFRSARRYAPPAFPGPLVLLQAAEGAAGLRAAQAARWRALAPAGLDVRTVPGTHADLLGPEHAPALAAALASALDEAGA